MPYLDSDGVRIFYTDSAPGTNLQPLLFVHGWTCDSHDWSWQLAELQDQHRVVAMDLRGHGSSDVPSQGFTLSDYARDVANLLRSLGGPPGVLIGHSMGALVASLVADVQPELTAGLVVVDPPYGLDEATAAAARDFAHRVEGVDGVQAVYDWLLPADSQTTPRWLATWHRRRILTMPHHALVETVRDVHASDTSMANGTRSTELWSRRQLPVLVITASREAAEREVPYFSDARSRAVSFEGVGHWLHQERPDKFNTVLDEWLKTVSP